MIWAKKSICEDGDLTPWAKQGVLPFKYNINCREAKPKSLITL